jgi:hypothetical protein
MQQSSKWKVQIHEIEEGRPVKSKAKSMLIIFFDVKGIIHKEFILASQTVNSTYYWDILRQLREDVQRLCPKLWQHKIWLLHYDIAPSLTPFSPQIFFLAKTT